MRPVSTLPNRAFSVPSGSEIPEVSKGDWVFLDSVVAEIDRCLASVPPEQGGALLGDFDARVVTMFIHDEVATTTGASYTPSLARDEPDGWSLEAGVQRVEREGHERAVGVIHSHPGGLDRPSGPDSEAFADSLRLNPQSPCFVAPIVTQRSGTLGRWELELPHGKLSLYAAARRGEGDAADVSLSRPSVRMLSLAGDSLALADKLGGRLLGLPVLASLDGLATVKVTVETGDGRILDIHAWPRVYPAGAPFVVVRDGSSSRALAIRWDISIPSAQRLGRCVAAALDELSRRSETASVLGSLRAELSTSDASEDDSGSSAPRSEPDGDKSALVREGFRARLKALAPPGVEGLSLVVVGAGSVGSQMAEAAVRSGFEDVHIVDPDSVGFENLSRSVYTAADAEDGRFKVDALAERLRAINPGVRVRAVRSTVADLGPEGLWELISDAAAVVGATDDPVAQAVLNHAAWSAGVPFIAVGMYAGGDAGEVIFVAPGLTRCYRCATKIRHNTATSGGSHDYGTDGRLTGEVALGADITHICSVATKILLALTALGDADHPLVTGFLLGELAASPAPRQMVICSTTPRWEFFEGLFSDVAGQGAFQSVWLSVRGDADCVVCGKDEVRRGFLDSPLRRRPTLDDFAMPSPVLPAVVSRPRHRRP